MASEKQIARSNQENAKRSSFRALGEAARGTDPVQCRQAWYGPANSAEFEAAASDASSP